MFHYLKRSPEEFYYGLGERSGPLNKKGMHFRMQNLDALGYDAEGTDPLYKHWPFYITFIPTYGLSYGLFYDTPAVCEFDLGREIDAYHGDYRYFKAQGGDIDGYMILGPSLPETVRTFYSMIGGMNLPPRWTLGYLGSSMAYAEGSGAQENLGKFLMQCTEHTIPCSGFHLSSGYTLGDDGRRYVFTWNRDRFPDPEGLLKEYHKSNVRIVANIKPCLLKEHPLYNEVESFGGFIRRASGGQTELDRSNMGVGNQSEGQIRELGPELSMFWGGEGSYLDFTNPRTWEWWKRKIVEQLFTKGIDGTWNDNNEYEVWDDEAICNGFGFPIPVGFCRPIQTLLMVRASWEVQREFFPQQRPYLISRSGYPGFQRYAQTWSGDNSTSWNSLRYNIPMGLGLSLSGCFNTGHDVGGFYGPQPDPELFLRWVENGIFHPRFSIHSWHTDGTSNEPWMYPEILPWIRKAIAYRYRLIPYLYTLMFEAVRRGEPIIRPLVYHYPDDPNVWEELFNFLLGPFLLVASVTEPNVTQKIVYLPGKKYWYEANTGILFSGGKKVQVEAPLERVPVFALEGAIIPFGKVPLPGQPIPNHAQMVQVFPPVSEGEGRFVLVEDDGETLDYREGKFSEILLSVDATPEKVYLSANVIRAGYPLPYTSLDFVLPGGEKRDILGGVVYGRNEKGEIKVRVSLSYSV
ncbi:MAG: Alpha-glucosidase [Candidatus Methanofastidiosum methylothiophilum]|uniref:Alpha-glucosidase n=1 Tax=Candidatus Methanofastidiosum methylothiophilum TaxID=1705564 RepID=A0A150J3U1_9EURY|nr:MAG: Alpha-glucosidase [Candidatus Methanofastidiosum methylthiophilus]